MNGRRILFVCPTCSPIGGLQTWLDQLCAGLQLRGWDPVVALVHGPSTHDSVEYRVAHPNLQTVVIDGSSLTMGARVREVMRTIRRLKPDFYVPLTVIDAHDAACELKRSGKHTTQYVLTVHGNDPKQIADATIFQPFADVAINPGVLTCRMLEWAGMPHDRIFHAPNGVDARPLRTASEPGAKLRLAYVGRLAEEDKRVMDLVGVVRGLETSGIDYHLDVVGNGPCEHRLKNAINVSSVTFHGFIESERLHCDYFPQWDILLMLSQSEGFGLSLIEAMVHGVVPVSSRFVGSAAEGFLIEGQTARFFEIGNTTECVKNICQLNTDRAELSALAHQAHDFAARTYSWRRCVDDWQAAMLQCLDFEPRDVPLNAVRPLDEGQSLASRFSWLPPACSDAFYKIKRRLLGIPDFMKHGEEWPWHTGRWNSKFLAEILTLTVEMDQRCAE